MASTKKGDAWHFGMKNPRSYRSEGTGAQRGDHAGFGACGGLSARRGVGDLRRQGLRGPAAKGTSRSTRHHLADASQGHRGRRLTCAVLSCNKKSNRVRARAEHPFGVNKHLRGYRKVRYLGIFKNTAQRFTLFALANFYLARRELALT